jgi:hypothetical protein
MLILALPIYRVGIDVACTILATTMASMDTLNINRRVSRRKHCTKQPLLIHPPVMSPIASGEGLYTR